MIFLLINSVFHTLGFQISGRSGLMSGSESDPPLPSDEEDSDDPPIPSGSYNLPAASQSEAYFDL